MEGEQLLLKELEIDLGVEVYKVGYTFKRVAVLTLLTLFKVQQLLLMPSSKAQNLDLAKGPLSSLHHPHLLL